MIRQNVSVQFAAEERAELERVVEALARWPRLSGLLRYMGEKLSSGDVDELNEYNLATEVLGRSKTVFKAAEDAIARVETHRLRKQLAVFYETEGRDHPIQISIPPGSYVPVFVHKSPAPASLPSESATAQFQAQSDGAYSFTWAHARRGYLLVTLSLLLAGVGIYLYLQVRAHTVSAKLADAPSPVRVAAPVPLGPVSLPVQILSGYSGPPRTDRAGRVWSPDRYFTGGGTWSYTPAFTARTDDPFLFEHSRTGEFSYQIPLRPGVYELHLFFLTPVHAYDGGFTFNVWINGTCVLEAFDINVDALGENVADERIFRDVSPDKDGFLRIKFSAGTGTATLNGLQVLHGLPHKQLPIRLIAQNTPLTDHSGQFWNPDDYFMNGRLNPQAHSLLDSPDPDLFSGERFGHFTYAIPTDPRDRYTLVLHFAELFFGRGNSGSAVGSRIFNVWCNGQTLLSHFDILKEAPSLHEVTKTFHHLEPTAAGKLNLTFEPIVNNATISGIEVLDESQ